MIFDIGRSKSYVLGIDLDDSYSQISYLASDAEMPETLSILAGAELYNIPTVLSRSKRDNLWYYGKEARERAASGGDHTVDRLVEKARKGDPVMVGDESYDPVRLLALFIKRSLSLLSMDLSMDLVRTIVFTVPDLDESMVRVLQGIRDALELKKCNIFYQSYEESFFYYMLYQKEELRVHDVMAVHYDYGDLTIYNLHINHSTRPEVTVVDKLVYSDLAMADGALPADPDKLSVLDDQLRYILKKEIDGKIISSVYFLGRGFRNGWMNNTLKYVCSGRRVFQGNNLFSKGASIAARERTNPGEVSARFLLLGEDKVRYNVGMKVQRRGQEEYLPLVDAGISYFEAAFSGEFILDKGTMLSFDVTPVTGEAPSSYSLELAGLPQRPDRCTRLLIRSSMKSATELFVEVTDLGFGEMEKASGMTWTLEEKLGEQERG
ncbi:DUF5716 family protein [Butyrivibrio sp. MC2013]|uniref:DUF5716 family protein n=1 Tax=Butyrivibrio sp. MC2013 TaxID=1280686 RepID=UPI00041659D6|nr:DUF5716 family protein [Butyrivibrio sp. MC2013]